MPQLCPKTLLGGYILVLVWIMLASALAQALLWPFIVCTISIEGIERLSSNLKGYIVGIRSRVHCVVVLIFKVSRGATLVKF